MLHDQLQHCGHLRGAVAERGAQEVSEQQEQRRGGQEVSEQQEVSVCDELCNLAPCPLSLHAPFSDDGLAKICSLVRDCHMYVDCK